MLESPFEAFTVVELVLKSLPVVFEFICDDFDPLFDDFEKLLVAFLFEIVEELLGFLVSWAIFELKGASVGVSGKIIVLLVFEGDFGIKDEFPDFAVGFLELIGDLPGLLVDFPGFMVDFSGFTVDFPDFRVEFSELCVKFLGFTVEVV